MTTHTPSDSAGAFDLDLPSARLRARAWGDADGPLVLCPHGLSGNHAAFARIAPELAAAVALGRVRAVRREIQAPVLLVRCTRPMKGGGLIVPDEEVAHLRAEIPQLRLRRRPQPLRAGLRALTGAAPRFAFASVADAAPRIDGTALRAGAITGKHVNPLGR